MKTKNKFLVSDKMKIVKCKYCGKKMVDEQAVPKEVIHHYEEIARLAKKLGVEKSIVFAGFIQDDDLKNYYQSADIFALPSLYEGFGIVYIDALANGVPVVTTTSASQGSAQTALALSATRTRTAPGREPARPRITRPTPRVPAVSGPPAPKPTIATRQCVTAMAEILSKASVPCARGTPIVTCNSSA